VAQWIRPQIKALGRVLQIWAFRLMLVLIAQSWMIPVQENQSPICRPRMTQ
jgi:hypothetical protein